MVLANLVPVALPTDAVSPLPFPVSLCGSVAEFVRSCWAILLASARASADGPAVAFSALMVRSRPRAERPTRSNPAQDRRLLRFCAALAFYNTHGTDTHNRQSAASNRRQSVLAPCVPRYCHTAGQSPHPNPPLHEGCWTTECVWGHRAGVARFQWFPGSLPCATGDPRALTTQNARPRKCA